MVISRLLINHFYIHNKERELKTYNMLIRFIKKTPNLNFIDNKKFFLYYSGLLSIISIFFLIIKGLNFGIDFKGGLLIETSFNKNIEIVQIRTKLNDIVPGDFSIQSLDNSKKIILLKLKHILHLKEIIKN